MACKAYIEVTVRKKRLNVRDLKYDKRIKKRPPETYISRLGSNSTAIWIDLYETFAIKT